jgi:hypothetical protein
VVEAEEARLESWIKAAEKPVAESWAASKVMESDPAEERVVAAA